jgi:hypothetical protein
MPEFVSTESTFSAAADIKLRTNVMIIIALASGFHSSLTKTGT